MADLPKEMKALRYVILAGDPAIDDALLFSWEMAGSLRLLLGLREPLKPS